MSDLEQRLASLSPAQRELLEKRLARQRGQVPARPGPSVGDVEPIVVVGMACRFAGAPNLDAYWKLIVEGIDGVREIPASRWDVEEFYDPTGEEPGKISVRWAALVDDIDQFDPPFFGITPREAAQMDPQQRLLLEVTWEALENAGIPPDQLAGTSTGVFVGIGGTDYAKVLVPQSNYYEQINPHSGTGNALSIAANRISYVLDLHGPSLSVDTACSSSSLGIHLAVESLNRGECSAALAGGVNAILTPETTIAFSKARMLSPDGKCRPFDAAANGYVRGEGCGIVVLKRLTDARREGDKIWAVLRATAVNQDGRTSGISAPNGRSQKACILAALRKAKIIPDEIGYIEAHGTGTSLGDPIEMQALGEIFTAGDGASAPCYVTSAKANVGHMETVSGVAGLIKVALMLQRETIPVQTHFRELNPHIRLAGTRLRIPTECVPWPVSEQLRIAGVSSFGFGGTNTHIIVEGPEHLEPRPGGHSNTDSPRPLHLLKISGRTEVALARQAQQIAEYLEFHSTAEAADVAYSANTGRVDFNHRLIVMASDATHLRDQLSAIAGGRQATGAKHGTVRTLGRPRLAFLFTGQGSQRVGMARSLYESHPTFRDTMDRCDQILREVWDESLLEIVYPQVSPENEKDARLHQTCFTQPALFAVEYALADLWRSWGAEPDIVLGHSVGEYVAACIAGVMDLEDGLRLIAERSRLMQQVKRRGGMAAIFAPEDRVAAALTGHDGVTIAAANGPENTVISGDAEVVERLVAKFKAEEVGARQLIVSHAFHSPLMDEMLEAFEEFAAGIEFHPPRVDLVSNLTGRLIEHAPTAQYWRDHLRNTVRFADGMCRIAEADVKLLIEIGPTASLLSMGRRCNLKFDAAWLPSLREGHNDWQVLLGSVAEFYCRGGQMDWRAFERPWQRQRLLLPNYPFERISCWHDTSPENRRPIGSPAVGFSTTASHRGHPLLGVQLSTVWNNTLNEVTLSAHSPPYLVDHQVQGSPIIPAAVYVEQSLAAAKEAFGAGRHAVDGLSIGQAMFLPEGLRRRVQVTVTPESGGQSAVEIYSRLAGDEDQAAWILHASGRLLHEESLLGVDDVPIPRIGLESVRDRAVDVSGRDDFYRQMAQRGLVYGPAFQVLDQLYRSAVDATAQIQLPESVRREAGAYHLHPVLGDALLQSMAGAVPLEADGSTSPYTYMPVGIRRVRIYGQLPDADQLLFSYARRTSDEAQSSPEVVVGDTMLVNREGQVLVAMEGVRVQRVGRADDEQPNVNNWLYRVAWRSVSSEERAGSSEVGLARSQPARPGAWLLFADSKGVARTLAQRLASLGEASLFVVPGGSFEFTPQSSSIDGSPATALLDPSDESHYEKLFAAAFGGPDRTCLGVIHLWSLDEPEIGGDAKGQSSAIHVSRRLGCHSVLSLLRQLARHRFTTSPPLWLVTRGAQVVRGDSNRSVAVGQATLWGMGKVAALENPGLNIRLVDLDPECDVSAAADALAQEMDSISDESQVALRGNERFVARLEWAADLLQTESDDASLEVPVESAFQLRITKPGSFDALRFVTYQPQAPEPGHVEVAIRAAGLNFSDVLKALGLYPGIKDDIVPLGIEASGVVTAVGKNVERFQVDDEVLGVVPYAFASHGVTAEYALVPKPPTLEHDEACTIPITFLTAYYSLVHLARLQPGERLLIHAGAGGVGLAAIQIAGHIGAEIFATAGSDEKREFLRSLGVRRVYNSRTFDFADEILADTQRQGVDVVLNSLPGAAIAKSFSVLRSYGRFLEIGKTDIYQDSKIGLLPFQNNLSYFAIDLDRMLRQRPQYIRELFAKVMARFSAGDYHPLMHTRFEADQTIRAFRYMSQRRNIGKVVVAIASRSEERGTRSEHHGKQTCSPGEIRRDGSYLVTGGLGAIGLRLADWLAERGAGGIALLSRRPPAPEIERHLQVLRDRGCLVAAYQADVTDQQSLSNAMTSIREDLPPLRGVIHAAGVLADGIIAEMTIEQFERAASPKIDGAWNLHRATQDLPLEFFLMFSSVASVLGSPGQANYAAGNAMLDALVGERRRRGLPATSINWGPWAGSGMAAKQGRDEAIRARGMALLAPALALDVMGQLLATDVGQVAVMDVRWDALTRLFGARRPPLLADVTESGADTATNTASQIDHVFRGQLLAADETTRVHRISDHIRQELARIMGAEPDILEAEQPLSVYGIDSLLALELKNNLESRLAFTLPMASLMEGPSIASLADETSKLLVADIAPAAASTDKAAAATKWCPLVPLCEKGDGTPLFLLPSLGGDIRCYDEFVQKLGNIRKVYAFRPRGLDDDIPPHASMTEMAHDYAIAVREICPTGPYHMAGWSTAGIYAIALANELANLGGEAALVVLFDSPLPAVFDRVRVDDDAHFLCDIVNFTNQWRGSNMRLDYQQMASLSPDDRFQSALAEARRQGALPAGAPEEYIRRIVRVGEANVRALQSYTPPVLNGTTQVHLFKPTKKGGLSLIAGQTVAEHGDLGWGVEVGQQLHMQEIPGDHFSMMLGDGAAELADAIRRLS